jgi:hypothetical protein
LSRSETFHVGICGHDTQISGSDPASNCGFVVRVPGYRSIHKSGFEPRPYQIFLEAVGLERDPLSLVSTTEELLERKSSGSGLEIREYGRRSPSRSPRGTIYPQTLALSSPTNGGSSVRIVRSRTQATEYFSFLEEQSDYECWVEKDLEGSSSGPCQDTNLVLTAKH